MFAGNEFFILQVGNTIVQFQLYGLIARPKSIIFKITRTRVHNINISKYIVITNNRNLEQLFFIRLCNIIYKPIDIY